MNINNQKPDRKVLFRIIICIIIVFVGIIGMSGLAKMKKPLVEVKYEEPSLRVDAREIKPEDVAVSITGHGEVRALDVVSIAPEVSGKIIKIHPRLEAGEVIPKGDTVFEIDPRDYKAALEDASATVKQLENSILLLKKQYEIDTERLKTIKRSCDIAKQQYERVRKLFEDDKVGTESGVDQAEQTCNTFSDQAEQMALAVDLYPIRIKEAENGLE